MEEKLSEAEEFLTIYKKKFTELNTESHQTEEVNQILEENAMKYEQLYREEKAKTEVLLSQKQLLSNKISQLTETIEKYGQREEESKLIGLCK